MPRRPSGAQKKGNVDGGRGGVGNWEGNTNEANGKQGKEP